LELLIKEKRPFGTEKPVNQFLQCHCLARPQNCKYCDELKAQGHADMIKKKTGLVLAYFSGTSKMDSRQCTRCTRKSRSRETLFGTDTWLIWKLTRGEKFMTDVSNASRTLLLNIHTLEWDTELLELFNIPKAMLPEVTKAAFIGETATTLFSTKFQ
jgi:glycerol kinase